MQLAGTGQFKLQRVETPTIQNSLEVLLQMEEVGICGSDIHYFTEGRIGEQQIDFPFIIGHECAGTVMETGDAVDSLQPGDRVAIDPSVSCGECDQCRKGRPHTCRNITFLGAPGQLSGALKENLVLPAENCFPIPDTFSFGQGVLVEPLSVGMYTAKYLEAPLDAHIAILGSGPIGLGVLLATQSLGYRNIFMTDKVPERSVVAGELGAIWTGNPDKVDVVSEVRSRHPVMLDAVIECCGQQEALDQAIELLKPGGALIIVGIPESNRVSFDIHSLRRTEITIRNVRRQNHCMKDAINLISTNPDATTRMLTHQYNINETNEAFEQVAQYREGVIKATIKVKN